MVYKHIPGGPRINLTSENEHIQEIGRQIRAIKEITRAVRYSLPFNKTPKLITIYIVFTFVRMLNFLPVKAGVSDILSTKTIMYSNTLHYKRHLGIKVGQYFQVHDHEDPSNSQLPQTKGEILLSCRATNPESHLP